MKLARLLLLLACGYALTALGQEPDRASGDEPHEGWSTYPGVPTPPPLLPPLPDGPPDAPGEEARAWRGEREEDVAPEPPNEVSAFGAPTLGAGRGGLGATLGFPYLSARAAYGVLPWLDLGLAIDSMYGAFSDVRGLVRLQLLKGGGWGLSVVADGGHAFFNQPAPAEQRGIRWFTGRRNWNLSPGLALSYQASSFRAARLFADARYSFAFDTEPFAREPLGGVPAAVQVSTHIPVRFGAEYPISRWTSYVFSFGFEIRGGAGDLPVLPTLALGLVTSLF